MSFALLVTLVWLYLEILRLLAKLQDRRRIGAQPNDPEMARGQADKRRGDTTEE